MFEHLYKDKNALTAKEKIYDILISLNFNSFKVFFFLTQEIKDVTNTCNTLEEKLNTYRKYLKKIKTTAETTSYKLNMQLPSLKKSVLSWIVEEIVFCEQQILHERSLQKNNREKKLLKISVPEVSLVSRLLYDSKLVNGSKKDFFAFLSNTFRTEKSALISSESLSNNYYSISESSKRSVKKMLKSMLLQLDQMEGEL